AVCLVVLMLVAHEVGQRETVVHRDMIDAGARAAVVVREQIRRSGHPAAELADEISFARPVTPQYLPEMVVPFRPAGRKIPDLIAAGTDVPWLRDQLHVGENGVLPDRRKKSRA